jgi:hypothetical protein
MGHRANLILVQNNQHRLFYCHWCSNTLTSDLFWGPEYAVPFIERQRPIDEDGWLDEVWAEGGVVLDMDHSVLLFWGEEDISMDIPLRRLYLALLQEVWKGWTVDWAFDGVFDMVAYLELSDSLVSADRQPVQRILNFNPPPKLEWTSVVASIVFEDGTLRFFPVFGQLDWRLLAGPALVEAAQRGPGMEALALEAWTDKFPIRGFHIEAKQKLIAIWAADEPGITRRVRPQWPGWQVEWLRDSFEFQLAQSRGLLTFPIRPVEAQLALLEKILLGSSEWDGPANLLNITEQERKAGYDIQINPYALRQDSQEVPGDIRRLILAKAIQAWHEKQGSIS